MRTRWWWCWSVFLLCVAWSSAASAQSLTGRFTDLVRGANVGDTAAAFCLIDLDDRRMIANAGADELMIPASNMKLVTTAAALSILGPDFTFVTELGLVDPAQPGAPPRLIVVGDGDPAFGDPILLREHNLRVDDLLDQWTGAVKASGEARFAELLIDDRVLDHTFAHPTWEKADQVNISGAQVAGINFFRNGLNITVIPTQSGQTPVVTLFPEAPAVSTLNRAVTGKRDDFRKDRQMGTNQVTFSGTIHNRQSEPYFIAIHDPPMVFASVLQNQLVKAGLTVDAVRRVADDEAAPPHRVLARFTTTLPVVLDRTNQDSQNMFAESLFKRIGRQTTGEPGSWDNGAAAIRKFLSEKLGTAATAVAIADGSGLSRDNRISAQLLAELLAEMARDKQLGPIYRDSLARGGQSGTLSDRFRWTDAEVYGKSGYMRGICSLSGYLNVPAAGDRPARRFAFSFIFNNYKPPVSNSDLKQLQERMLRSVVDDVKNGKL